MFIIFSFLLLVFFFKQKTSYEMRISDLSSDVCSSDLASTQSLSPSRPSARPAASTMRSRSAGAIGTVVLFSVSLSFMSRPPLRRTGAVPGGHDVPGVILPDDGDTMNPASVRRTGRLCNDDLC